MTTAVDPLNELAYWHDWQLRVLEGLPNFAAQAMYVEQESVDPEEVEKVLSGLRYHIDAAGMLRDVQHGGLKFETSFGAVTRMWVDANVEIDFLYRSLGKRLNSADVLEIGAGYGRLAVSLAPLTRSYTCVDAVFLSTLLCRYYTSIHTRFPIDVYDVTQFRKFSGGLRPTLAINIHSWNECSRDQIAQWLDILDALKVKWLFTVSHGRNDNESSYLTCEKGEPSFKYLLDEKYELVVEENIGIGRHPHAMWWRR